MIPLEAVEAAMIAFANAPYDPPPTTEAQMNRANQEQMKLALEAAAPYMLKSAYDLGFEHGSNEPPNPYRSKP